MQLRKPEHKPSFFQNLLSNFLPAPTRRVLSDKKIDKHKKINLSLTQDKKSKTTQKITLTNPIHAKQTPSTTNHHHTNSNTQCDKTQKARGQPNRGLNFHPRKINFQNENSLKPKIKSKIVLNCSYNNNSQRNEPYNLVIDRNNRGHLNISPNRKGQESSIFYHTIDNIRNQSHNRSYQQIKKQEKHHSQIIKKFNIHLESTQKKGNISPLLQVKKSIQKISQFENGGFFLKQQEKDVHSIAEEKSEECNLVAINQSMKQLTTGNISTILQEPQIENETNLESKLLQTPRNLKQIEQNKEIEIESISSSENEGDHQRLIMKKDNFRENLYDNIQTVQSKYDGSSKKSVSDCQSHVLYRMNGDDFKNQPLISTPNKFNAFNRMTAYEENKQEGQIQRRKSLNTNLFSNYEENQHLYGSQDKQLNMNFKKKKQILLKLSPRIQDVNRFRDFNNGRKNCIEDFFTKIQPNIVSQSEIFTSKHLKSENDEKINSLYDKLRKVNYVGVGRFASVYLCIDPVINFILAVKEVLKFTISYNCLENQLMQQIQIQQSCNHPNLINLYHYWVDEKKFYIALEYGQETLLQKLQKQKYFDERQCLRIIKQIADGLHYLHLRGIVHRDIKPENIIMVNGVCKVSDFGWATRISFHHLTQICGTPCYISPQIQKSEPYSFKTDCWSLGVLAYEIANGKINEQFFAYSSINRQQLKFEKYITSQYKNMLYKLLAPEQNQRVSIAQLLSFPIFTNL